MHKLTKTETQKLFFKSKLIFKTAFFYIKIHYKKNHETHLKNIIVIPKKCGNAVRRNYLRRITKYLIKKYFNMDNKNTLLFIYMKINMDAINYKVLEKHFNDINLP